MWYASSYSTYTVRSDASFGINRERVKQNAMLDIRTNVSVYLACYRGTPAAAFSIRGTRDGRRGPVRCVRHLFKQRVSGSLRDSTVQSRTRTCACASTPPRILARARYGERWARTRRVFGLVRHQCPSGRLPVVLEACVRNSAPFVHLPYVRSPVTFRWLDNRTVPS